MPATLPITCPRCTATTPIVGRFCPRCGAANTIAPAIRRLNTVPGTERFAAFLPTLAMDVEGVRRLDLHPAIASLDVLYSLAEVRAAYPEGLDERDAAWIWRRLLSVLAFLHETDVVHAAVFPEHVLIEPIEHGVVLAGWWSPVVNASANRLPIEHLPERYKPWFRSEAATRLPPTPALDVAFAARCIIELTGGDGATGVASPKLDPGLTRHFERCLHSGNATSARPGASQLLNDFDRLIEALWGPRRYRPLAMPQKRTSN